MKTKSAVRSAIELLESGIVDPRMDVLSAIDSLRSVEKNLAAIHESQKSIRDQSDADEIRRFQEEADKSIERCLGVIRSMTSGGAWVFYSNIEKNVIRNRWAIRYGINKNKFREVIHGMVDAGELIAEGKRVRRSEES